jgi:hypothetical protein
VEQLSKLASLRDAGTLSEEEFRAIKTRLLNGGASAPPQAPPEAPPPTYDGDEGYVLEKYPDCPPPAYMPS